MKPLFRKFKDPVQGFCIQKLPKSGVPYPRFTKGCYVTESVPEYAVGKTARVVTENGQWWLCCYDTIYLKPVENLTKVCALDCGVRTFQTVFSMSEVSYLGEDFYKDRILPLLLSLDGLYSKKKKLSKQPECQARDDLLRCYQKKIFKLRSRIKNLKDDLYKKCANYLTNEFDIILLPTFETQQMSKAGNRKINSKAVRGMLGLGHYRFKQVLKWFAVKKGKIVIDVCESYTSKTNPFTGRLMEIGSSKTFKNEGVSYDRDVNGARNIFIKNTLLKDNEE